MEKQNLLYSSFFASIILIFVGAFFKLQHWDYASNLIIIGLVSLALFVMIALTEVMGSKKIEGTEKFMWTIGFLFFGLITGLIYMLSARKRIINNQ